MQKRTLLKMAAALPIATGLPAAFAAPAFPAHDLKIVIPFAPGGGTDVIFRLISERAEKELGKPIVPMNMSGAGGSKGATYVKGSKADGYTLLGGHEFLLTTYYGGLVNFGLEAFEPVATLAATPLTITAGAHTPYNTYEEMLKFARENPGKAIVSMSPASVGFVLWYQIAKTAGLELDRDFRTVIINGSGPRTKALLGAHIDLDGGDVPSNNEYVKDGRMKFLAVAHERRLAGIPTVPTLKELGYDVKLAVTRAVFAPKGTPVDTVNAIAAAYKIACEDPAIIQKIEELGSEMNYLDPKGTAEYFASQDAVYKEALSK